MKRMRWALSVGLLALATMTISVVRPAYGQTRPETPDVLGVHRVLNVESPDYAACVGPKKIEAIASMWERKAPIDAALHEISHAYRQCEGFGEFWAAIYFLGFDSPEQWIQIELQAVKAAAAARAETDIETMRAARVFLREALAAIGDVARLSDEDRAEAEAALSEMIYTVDSLRPREGDAETVAPLLEAAQDFYLEHLPDETETALADALDFADVKAADPRKSLEQVKRTALRGR